MEREIALARGKPGVEDRMLHQQAMVLAHSGHMREARMMWQRAAALAQQTGDRERAAIFEAAAAVCEAHLGNAAAAKRRVLAALELGKGRDVEYAASFSPIPSARWRTCNSAEPSLCPEIRPKRRLPTRIS